MSLSSSEDHHLPPKVQNRHPIVYAVTNVVVLIVSIITIVISVTDVRFIIAVVVITIVIIAVIAVIVVEELLIRVAKGEHMPDYQNHYSYLFSSS